MERLACCIPVLTLILRIHELQFRPHARPGVGECVFSPKCELGPESLEGRDGVCVGGGGSEEDGTFSSFLQMTFKTTTPHTHPALTSPPPLH